MGQVEQSVRAATARAPESAAPLVDTAILVAKALDSPDVTERGLVELSKELRQLLSAIAAQTPQADSGLDDILARIAAPGFSN